MVPQMKSKLAIAKPSIAKCALNKFRVLYTYLGFLREAL